MADTASRLVDEVLPQVPVRQWVLSVPRPIRYVLARDAKLLSAALRIFVQEIFRDLRRRAVGGEPGAVTAVQRFGGALNLNVHFHTLVLDGVYVGDPPEFRPLPAPSAEDLEGVLRRVRIRLERLLARKGALPAVSAEPPAEEPEALDLFQAGSIREWDVLSGRPRPATVVGRDEEAVARRPQKGLCAEEEGYSLQAAVRIAGHDREGLEILCRYLVRPPFAEDRLRRLEDGRVLYKFRRPRPDGSTHVVLEPLEFLARLAALVPPPRFHLVHYHGVLAPHARRRKKVVPVASEGGEDRECRWREEEVPFPATAGRGGGKRRRRSRTDWAKLLKRSLDVDVLSCPRCAGRMEVMACITRPALAATILRAMGLRPGEPEPVSPGPPERGQGFLFDQD